ncbi:coiled-coil domain-containing protein 167-like [Coccinella septempunctata]|uniref:coiled-coil domain-containing protein 167-like n=1 Tax=Coccinella septempunctata TaxID=41139 RepID=UPI001D079FFD|nr:coiled-coil domain-containing protein 167-like [Coccinella septempunctata]
MANLGCSLMQEMKKTEEAMSECYDRIKDIERKMVTRELSPEEERTMRLELEEVKKLLATNTDLLKNLHRGNRGNFFIAFGVLFVFILIFIVFKAMKGDL